MQMNRHAELDLGELIRQVREDKNTALTPAALQVCPPAQNLRDQLSKILATTRLISSGHLSMPQARQMALQIENMAQTGLSGKLGCQDQKADSPPHNIAWNATSPQPENKELDCLSKREQEILKGLAQGQSVHEIAALLCRSPKTVNNHRTNILHKLNLRNTAELTRLAIRHKLVEP
jgi:DNA-binding NarL/FixJ family response regulator